jgi:sugar lactone lactonase YvrE
MLFDPPPFFPVEGPQLALFKRGYGGWRFRGSSRDLTGPGVVIEMRPLVTDAEQIDYLERRPRADRRALAEWEHAEGPANPYDVPYESAGRYEATINAARAARGLGPTGIGFPHLLAEYFTPAPPEPPGHARLREPHGIAVAANGDVYVADTNNHRIVKLGRRLELLATWGTFGRGEGQLQLPRAVAVDGDVVYVADWGTHRVQAFTTDGRFLRKWGRLRSDDLGGTFTPTTIATTRGGEIVVYAGRVYRFSASGAVLGKWGRPFHLASRSEIAVDADGHVYAITGEAGARERVIKLNRDGGQLASWGREGQGVGELFDPIALAVDHAGRVYVACWGGGRNPRVVVYDARGTFVHQWDVASGSAPWLRMPTALAIDAQGVVYVTDLKQDRVHTLPALGR